MNITILGSGIIGSRAASHLATNPTHQVTTWNRTPKGLPNENPDLSSAVQQADVISLYLKDSSAVREVFAQICQFTEKSPAILNHSTVGLDTTNWLASECQSRKWDFLDAPFTGSRDAAENAQLVYYVSGHPSVIENMRDVLESTSRLIIPCGEIGHATIIKLITNLISACSVQALAEALAIGRQHHLSPEFITQAIQANACASPLINMKLPTMLDGEFQPHFSLSNMLKDSQYALQLAQNLDTPAIHAVSQRMQELCRHGFGDLDYSALAKAYQNHE